MGGDLAARWGWLEPGQDWRNLALTPNFDEVGPVAVSMWKAVKHQQVDGVIMIDVEAQMCIRDSSTVARRLSARRIARSPVPVTHVGLDGTALPLEDKSCDSALCTFTLCTIPDVRQALGE